MTRVRLSVVAMLVVLCVHGQALAQPRITQDIVSTNEALTPDKLQSVQQYASFWVDQLVKGTDEEMSQARQRLVDPLNSPSTSDVFARVYSPMVSKGLANGMNADHLLVKINALLVAKYLRDPAAANVLIAGLSDGREGLVYLASQAVAQVGPTNALGDVEQKNVLAALNKALKNNPSPRVLEQLLFAMSSLTIPEAMRASMDSLNSRADMHAANPGNNITPELELIKRLFPELVRKQAMGQANQDAIVQLAKVAVRYQILALKMFDHGHVPASMAEDYKKLIETTDVTLKWAINTLNPAAQVPAPITPGALLKGDWAVLLLRAQGWKPPLGQAPFNFPPADLDVNFKAN